MAEHASLEQAMPYRSGRTASYTRQRIPSLHDERTLDLQILLQG